MDGTRGMGDALRKPIDADGTRVDGGAVIGRILREQGVRYCFTVNGGHIWPILSHLRDHDVQMIHMRHEQTCAYAADAWARTTRTPGVLAVTAGCGLTNAVTGLCVAGLVGSAVVCLSGQHPAREDGMGAFQEAYGSDICRTFSRFTKRTLDWTTIGADLRMAFRAAMGPPPGPALLEIPTDVLYRQDDVARQRGGAVVHPPDALRSAAAPDTIDRVLDALAGAERPLLVAGDGVFWSDAAAELHALASHLAIPVYTRRAAQGAVPEDDALAVRGAWKKPFTGRADVVVAVGFTFWSGEHFGEPPTWNADATYVQIDAVPARVGWHVPVAIPVVGDPKLVLRQLLARARARGLDAGARADGAWLADVARARAEFDRALREQEAGVHAATPIHPARLVHDLLSVLDRDATIVIDSFTLSGWLSQWLVARFPGQIVDAGPLAPVGHGIGMGIGAQLARPGKQVVVVIGDGGLGIGGMDVETALKHRLPILTLVWNNSSWGPGFDQMPMLRGRVDAFDMLPDLRYDRMFAAIGAHGEHVAAPDEIVPALERALRSGVTSVVNVLGDPRVGHARLGGNLLGSTKV